MKACWDRESERDRERGRKRKELDRSRTNICTCCSIWVIVLQLFDWQVKSQSLLVLFEALIMQSCPQQSRQIVEFWLGQTPSRTLDGPEKDRHRLRCQQALTKCCLAMQGAAFYKDIVCPMPSCSKVVDDSSSVLPLLWHAYVKFPHRRPMKWCAKHVKVSFGCWEQPWK